MTFVSAPDGSPARRPDGSERGDVGADAQAAPDPEPGKAPRRSRRVLAINSSPLARKIISFNLLALLILVAGVLYLNPFRDSLVFQREQGLVFEAHLIADVFEAVATTEEAASDLGAMNVPRLVASLDLAPSLELFVFAPDGEVLARGEGAKRSEWVALTETDAPPPTFITDMFITLWEGIARLLGREKLPVLLASEDQARSLLPGALTGRTTIENSIDPAGNQIFAVGTPILIRGEVAGVVALTTASGEIDTLVQNEREQFLQMFMVALLVSIGLSLVLAGTIANPLSDLAAAAELGRDRNARKMSPGRVRIPDLTTRPDEIGRLSGALRGMVSALYDRIDANEQFAADVAHEIKNPLASLRSATGTLRVAKREDQRQKLLNVIEHDVRRLDRLVSDISNASRLDSELVKEEEETFDLIKMLRTLTDFHAEEVAKRGIDFITDLPPRPLPIQGLEPRLAQVFVNLLGNAISFCEQGDAVRLWVRQRDNRVLIVVEDTGPGIPEEALNKIFTRFYSERPERQFGNHSGLGLAISKQIVEAHGGVIWAENIRPTDLDITSEPLGARFIVGLPL
ncbi:sensor N-terminal transmembrane domain-containing protein [Dinoroseobacter sp. S76]|uniref:sensor N-terminal transmembrane domain-containing protein n=1 Tax=Dinoroseobacter sp. S76 TaxID=3415124 RepID=UPI003C7D9832